MDALLDIRLKTKNMTTNLKYPFNIVMLFFSILASVYLFRLEELPLWFIRGLAFVFLLIAIKYMASIVIDYINDKTL